jgi:hypothetical protein
MVLMTVPFAARHVIESGVAPPNACRMKLPGMRTTKTFLTGRAVTLNGGTGFAPPNRAGKCSVTNATPSGTTPLRTVPVPHWKPIRLIAPRCKSGRAGRAALHRGRERRAG